MGILEIILLVLLGVPGVIAIIMGFVVGFGLLFANCSDAIERIFGVMWIMLMSAVVLMPFVGTSIDLFEDDFFEQAEREDCHANPEK